MKPDQAFARLRQANPVDRRAVASLALGDAEEEMLAGVVRTPQTAPSPRRARQQRLAGIPAPALLAVALILCAVLAVPPTRAALGGAAGSIASVFDGGTRTDPGRPVVPADHAPSYFDDGRWAQANVHDPRVLAEAGGYRLFVYRGADGTINFDLGDTGFGEGFPGPGFFRKSSIYVLGPGSMSHVDGKGQVPLFGLVADQVRSVELTYAEGPPLRLAGIRDGFVLLAEPAREPLQVLAFDHEGRLVAQHSVTYIGWSQYLGR